MADTLFDQFWRNHPALQTPPDIQPCQTKGVSNHDNQCVIRLGIAMTASGISLATYRGVCCWSGHGRTHPLRVEQIKLWLNSDDAYFVPYAAISKRTKQGHQNTSHSYAGQRGIVACINFWGRGNRGDHIDLWDGTTMAHGGLDYFERSQEIWFWEMD
jgi:Type VI secretion system (T6SS), amidase effector protein 4